MSQEQAIEAARGRIQRLVEEISALSKRDLSTEQFLPEFITRVVQATDARGGAVWLVGQRSAEGKAEFQLAATVEFESSGFQSDEIQRAVILRALAECVNQRQPVAMQPMPPASQEGSLESQLAQLRGEVQPPTPKNRTPHPFLHVPLPLKDQVLGVLQVWLQPYVVTENYQEFASFLIQLAGYVEQHFQSRRLGTLVLETQRLQHLLKFTGDLAGSLDPLEISRLASNYGRDVIGCERCSVLWREHGQWRVLSISGQEVVEKKSAMVKAMGAFVGAHARPEMVTLSKKALLAAHASNGASGAMPAAENEKVAAAQAPEPPPVVKTAAPTDGVDLAYFEVSHVTSAAIAPILDDDKQLVGAFFAESTTEGFFEAPPNAREQPLALRVTEWLATHAGKQLRAAQDFHHMPLRRMSARLHAARRAFTGPRRGRNWGRFIAVSVIAAAILLYPKQETVEGDCTLLPVRHNAIVSEVAGRVERILVREGSRVGKDEPVAELDKRRMETDLEAARRDIARLEAEAEKARGEGNEASAQVASLQAAAAREHARKLETDIAAATLRSPIDGVVITKDVEKNAGEFIQPGTVFAEVAGLEAWELRIDVDQKRIGKVERRLASGPIDVSYILYSQTAHTLQTQLKDVSQISAAAEPRDVEHVFVLTFEPVEIPAEIESSMRPGLTGRARLELGRKPLGWLWLRGIWDWLQLRFIG